jgi:hypothetical protein
MKGKALTLTWLPTRLETDSLPLGGRFGLNHRQSPCVLTIFVTLRKWFQFHRIRGIIYVRYAYCREVKKSFVKNLRMGDKGKSFEENLGMGEWAPLPACRSSCTPLPPLCVCLPMTRRAPLCVPATCRRWLCVPAVCVCRRCARITNDPSVSNINDQQVSKNQPEGGPITFSFSIVSDYVL